jgi:hypothetical protein
MRAREPQLWLLLFQASHLAERCDRQADANLKVKRNARRTLKEIGLSASGSCSGEQSQPRHKDLNAGIWIRAVRRAHLELHRVNR